MKNLKKVLALVLAFACAFTMFAGAAFTDQADIETADAVDTLVALGVIDGYEDGSFQPDVTVNRAEMAKMIYTILNGGNDDASAYENLPTSFTDLGQEGWATGYIKYLQNTGIIAGKTVTQFAPSDTVTGVEAAKMMLVAAGYSADKAGLEGSAWIANTMRYANMNNLFDGVSCDVNSGLPRQYAAQIMYNSLDMENVVYSNDIEGFKPATDVNEDKTIGGKYMDLITYEGILSGSGEFGTGAGKDKIAMDPIMKINGDASVRDDSGKYLNDTWDYEEDVTDLVGQYVKVQTGKDDKVYGVFAVASENTVVTTTISKLDTTKWDSGKIEIDGTEYRIADDFDTKIAGNISFAEKKGIADLKELRSGDLITFISNDGDNKFDSAYANVMKAFGEVLYIGDDEITVSNMTSKIDIDESIVPDDLAKGDYVAVYEDLYTGNDLLVKADKVNGKIEMTKNNDVRIDGTWYTLGATDLKSTISNTVNADIDSKGADPDDTYTLYLINDVAYKAKEESSSSTDTAFVITAPGSMTVNGNYQVKLLFADNSQTVVEADKAYNAEGNGGNLVGKLVTYETDSDGVYELKAVNNTDNKAGGDSVVFSTTGASFDEDATRVKIDSNDYRVSSSAVVYIQYKDSDGAQYRAMTGADLNKLGSNFVADKDGGIVIVKDGLASVVMLKSASNDLPGTAADTMYGYVTDLVGNSKDYKEYTIWTNENTEITAKLKATNVTVEKGDLISFKLTDDNYLENVKSSNSKNETNKLDIVAGAVSGVEDDAVIFYQNNTADRNVIDLDDDVKYVYISGEDGANGSSLSTAQAKETDVYYINSYYVLEDNKIVMIASDISGRWNETDATVTAKAAEEVTYTAQVSADPAVPSETVEITIEGEASGLSTGDTVTVKVAKNDGAQFGAGTYTLTVEGADAPESQVIKADSTSEITFEVTVGTSDITVTGVTKA